MGTATDDTTTFPHEIDDRYLAWPVVAGWMLDDDRRVLVVHDRAPECPLDVWEHDCTFYWADRAPWWNTDGIGCSDESMYERRPETAVLFSVTEERDGNHYRVEDEPEHADGYIIPPDDATNPREYVAGVLDTLTLWATGECYWWREEHRDTWHNGDGDTRYTWEPDESCSGYYGMDAVIEGIRESVEGAEEVSA